MKGFLIAVCVFCVYMTVAYLLRILKPSKKPLHKTEKYDLPFKNKVRSKKPPKN